MTVLMIVERASDAARLQKLIDSPDVVVRGYLGALHGYRCETIVIQRPHPEVRDVWGPARNFAFDEWVRIHVGNRLLKDGKLIWVD